MRHDFFVFLASVCTSSVFKHKRVMHNVDTSAPDELDEFWKECYRL